MPWSVLLIFAVLAITAGAGVNSVLGLMSVAVLTFAVWLLWRPGRSPIFVFIVGYQWLQASTKIFDANLRGLPINDMAQFGSDVATATALSLTGLLVLAIGAHLGLGRSRQMTIRAGFLNIEDKPPMFWFWLYTTALGASLFAQSVAYAVPALSQPLIAVASLRWAFYWILAHVALQHTGTVRWLWLLFFTLELVLGTTGYFSSFKTVLFFTMLAGLSSRVKMTTVRVVVLLGISAGAVVMAIGWTAIKTEQRKFLSQDERAQVVTVSIQESLANIAELTAQLDMEAMSEATGVLASRIAYVDYFGRVLDTVPEDVPYEQGAIWGDAIVRPFMPRLFFPDKAAIDDSERTSYYTGLNVSGKDEGTSISLGYMAEAYIDFGPWLMMLPILALGWAYGRFHRWMVSYPFSSGVIGAGLATATLYPAAYLETSITKLFGGLVVAALVAWLIARLGVPLLRSVRLKKAGPGITGG